MSDTREPTGQVDPTGFERVTPPRRPRFDELFAGAIEEQLSEQRTLNELLARVDATLQELRNEFINRPQERDDTAAVEALVVVQQSASALVESFPQRLDEVKEAVVAALAVRDDVDRLGTAGMLRRLEELRDELDVRLNQRDEQAAELIRASIATLREQANEVGKVHQMLTDRTSASTSRLAEIVESSSTGQQATIAAVETAASRIEMLQHEMRDRLAEIVASSVSDLQQASLQAAAGQASQLEAALETIRRAAADAGAEFPQRVEAATHELRTIVSDAATQLPAQVDAAAQELNAVVESASRQLSSTVATDTAELAEAAATLARVAAELGPAVANTTREVRVAMREAVDEDRTVVQEALGEKTEQMRAAIAGEVQQLSEAAAGEVRQLSAAAAGVLSALQETTSSVGTGLTDRIQAAARSMAEVVNEARSTLLSAAETDRQEMQTALAEVRAVAKSIADELQTSLENADRSRTAATGEVAHLSQSVRALQTEIEELAARFGAAVAEQEARARSVTDGLGERVEVLLDNFRGSTSAELATVARTVAGLREDLEHSTKDSAQLIDHVVARLDEAARHHVEAASNSSDEVASRARTIDEAAAALARVAGNIEPMLAETAGEVLAALRQTAKDDRAQMRDGIARIQQSAERMGDSLEATMVRHIDAVHATSTRELAGANQSLAAARRALEDSAAALAGSVARRAADTGAATGAQVAELQLAVDDLRTLLERELRELRARAVPAPSPEPAAAAPSRQAAPPAAAPSPPADAVTPPAAAAPPAPAVPDIDDEALAATLSIFGGPSGVRDDEDDDV